MSILIKDMEMPTRCVECWLLVCACRGEHKDRPDWCPLVEVPAHGRLVDADRLEVIAYTGTDGRPDTFDAGVEWLAEKIDALPTVIPKEEA